MVGHHPILMVGVAALIHNDDGQLLLLKRSDNHCWGPPGGSTEPGEQIEETLRREVEEETGMNIHSLELYGAFSGPEFFYTYPNGDQVFNVTIMYTAKINNGTVPVLDHEHTDWQWYHPDQIPNEISPPMIPILKDYQTKRNRSHP